MRLGIDIGGTKTDAVAIESSGQVNHRIRLPTGFGPEAVVSTAVRAIEGLLHQANVTAGEVGSIGIGIPGTVDSDSGFVAHAVNLGLDGLHLGAAIRQRLHVSVRIENDVNAAALGAYSLLGHATSMAYLNLGTGLAAGLVLNGRLWRGAWGAAGEIGHIPIDPNGELCACGQRGCLELVASGSAIARAWVVSEGLPAPSLFAAAQAGDETALRIRARFIDGIASAVRILVLTTDVDRVVIGGGLSNLGAPLLSAVHAVLGDWAASSAFIASLDLERRVMLLPAGFPAAAVGAALVGIPSSATAPAPEPERVT